MNRNDHSENKAQRTQKLPAFSKLIQRDQKSLRNVFQCPAQFAENLIRFIVPKVFWVPEQDSGEREHPPRSCKKIFRVRIKTEVPMFLIVFDLLFQMQEKSRRSISEKGRNARFLKIVKLDQPGRYDLFCRNISISV